MKEGDHFAGCTFEWDFVDELNAGGGCLLQLAREVSRGEGDVVDAASRVFLQKFSDGALRGSRLQELDMHFAGVKEGRADLLGFDDLAVFTLQAKGLFIIRNAIFKRTNSDSYVVNFSDHGVCWRDYS